MNNFWKVARHEYRKSVGRRSFLIGTLGIPLMMFLVMGVAILAAINTGEGHSLGFIDQAGFLDLNLINQTAPPGEEGVESPVELIPYADIEPARRDLNDGKLAAFYVLPPDYLSSGQLELYYLETAPGEQAQAGFYRLVSASLLAHAGQAQPVSGAMGASLAEPPRLVVRSVDGSREIGQGDFLNLILPFLAAFALIFTVTMNAGSLLQVVADEKESRTIEILVTTLTPEQLVGGKALGLLGVCLTQLAIWGGAVTVGLRVGGQFNAQIRNIAIPYDFLLFVALFFIPAYGLVAACMIAVGGTLGDLRQGQQIAGLFNIFFMLPMFLSMAIISNPAGPLSLFLTLFPFTSFATIALRWSFSAVPLWQMGLSWVLLVACLITAVWAAARIFRLGMLRYGQGLRMATALAALFSGK